MKLKDVDVWERWVKACSDSSYGLALISLTKKAIGVLEAKEDGEELHAYGIITEAIRIGGSQAKPFTRDCMARAISYCHERGEEFRLKWNEETEDMRYSTFAGKEKAMLQHLIEKASSQELKKRGDELKKRILADEQKKLSSRSTNTRAPKTYT